MNGKTFIKNLITTRPILKARCLLSVMMVAFGSLGLAFLGLALISGFVQAAPADQGQVWQFTLPVTNTGSQTSIYTVTNLTTNTISVRHEFYAGGFPDGRFVAVLTDTYFLFERKIYALSRIPNFPSDFVGVVVVKSNQPITGSAVTRAIALPTPVPSNPVPEGERWLVLPPLPLLQPERVEINWTLVTYIIIGIFALVGFFKGWWKEAITTFFLGILIFFLVVPQVAAWVIAAINRALVFVWDLLNNLNINLPFNLIQLDAGSGQTWLFILLLFIGLAIFISRASLPSRVYVVTPVGAVMGAILGGLNGFIVINLVKQYLEGNNLPGSTQPATEIVMTGGNVVAVTSSGLNIQFMDLPGFVLFNALLPWIIIVFGILIIFLISRYKGGPWGYTPLK